MESEAFVNESSNTMTEGSPDEMQDDESGLPPMIQILHTGSVLRIVLVKSDDDASIIIGVQFLLPDNVVSTRRLHHQRMKLSNLPGSKLDSKCYQLSGHPSNDGKQINILTGQGSCSVAHPMPCCMVRKNELGRPPRWICL